HYVGAQPEVGEPGVVVAGVVLGARRLVVCVVGERMQSLGQHHAVVVGLDTHRVGVAAALGRNCPCAREHHCGAESSSDPVGGGPSGNTSPSACRPLRRVLHRSLSVGGGWPAMAQASGLRTKAKSRLWLPSGCGRQSPTSDSRTPNTASESRYLSALRNTC